MMFFLLRKKIEALHQTLAKLSSANEKDNINALRERNVQYQRIIEEQRNLLQLSLYEEDIKSREMISNPENLDDSKIEMERLQLHKERQLFEEQKQRFELERKRFTDELLKLSEDHLQLERAQREDQTRIECQIQNETLCKTLCTTPKGPFRSPLSVSTPNFLDRCLATSSNENATLITSTKTMEITSPILCGVGNGNVPFPSLSTLPTLSPTLDTLLMNTNGGFRTIDDGLGISPVASGRRTWILPRDTDSFINQLGYRNLDQWLDEGEKELENDHFQE